MNQPSGFGYSYSLASQIAAGGSYLTSPDKVRYSVSPKGLFSITYISKAEAISTIDASEKSTDWSGPNAWTTISAGQAAECNAVLLKPAKPDPMPGYVLGQPKHMAVKVSKFVVKAAVGEAAGPVVGFAAGKAVDYLSAWVSAAQAKKSRAVQRLGAGVRCDQPAICPQDPVDRYQLRGITSNAITSLSALRLAAPVHPV